MIFEGECGAVLESSFKGGVELKTRFFKQKEVEIKGGPFYKKNVTVRLGIY